MPNPPDATIEITAISKSFGANRVLDNVDLVVEPGSAVALLGPSGCGKTTLLRTIAGLERPDGGTIAIDGQLVVGPRVDVPPERRRIGMVFQDWALFPHLTVAANVGYGLTRAERRAGRVAAALELVGLDGFGDRMPATLSGGQQQRVALARALAPRPRAILLDEPFSNLDTALRVQVRTEVHALLARLGITTVFVTHDQEEAFVLGDQVAVMDGGRVVQRSTPAELYDSPVSEWVASFVGEANVIRGEARGTTATTAIGDVRLRAEAHGPVDVLLRPEQIVLRALDGLDADDIVPDGRDGRVELVEFYGHDSIVIVRFEDGTELRSRLAGAPAIGRGDEVRVTPAATPTVVFGAAQPERSFSRSTSSAMGSAESAMSANAGAAARP